MKELSIEQKTKAYDEALERAKKLYEQGTITESLSYVFPELKENEDERIRKELIKYFTKGKEYLSLIPYSKDECIAWLEKQGEHAKFRESIQVGDQVTRNQDGVLVNLSQLKRVAKPAEQKSIVEPKFKVKYAGSEYNVFETKDIAGVTFYGIEDEPNHIDYVKAENCDIISCYAIKENGSPYPTKPAVFSEQKHSKQEWNEEDDKIIEEIINDIECARAINYHAPKEGYEFRENWLKSLRPQSKQELDEDTQQWVDAIIKDYEDLRDENKNHAATIETKIQILKSLRPQNRWKPSDEQMNAFEQFVRGFAESGYASPYEKHTKLLYSLLNDLKKLREE